MRKILFGLLATLLTAGASPAASAQDFPGRDRIPLSGTWQSSLGDCWLPGTTDENRLGDGKHPTDATAQLTRLYPFAGQVTYERYIDIPADWQGRKLRLVIERTKPSTLWIDGDSIGSLHHLYAPHCYELPPLAPGRHRIALRINNAPDAVPQEIHGSHAWAESTQTNWNGILGDFYLEARCPSYIDDAQVYPSARQKKAVLRLAIHAARSRPEGRRHRRHLLPGGTAAVGQHHQGQSPPERLPGARRPDDSPPAGQPSFLHDAGTGQRAVGRH